MNNIYELAYLILHRHHLLEMKKSSDYKVGSYNTLTKLIHELVLALAGLSRCLCNNAYC